MNEFGIDSLQLANGQPLTQAMVDDIAYIIQKNGFSSSGPDDIGTAAYFNQTFTTYTYWEQNIQIMQQNNKPIGAYFFSYAWDYASAYYEAELECGGLAACTYQPDWPVFIDWETASKNAVIAHGYPVTSAMLSDIVHGWADGCRAHGYIPGFYTGAAIARDDFGATLIQQLRSENIYFWEAHYGVATPWIVPYDIWQYEDNEIWHGVYYVDYNKIGDDRMWNIGPGPGSNVPTWLKIYLSKRGDNSGKCALLL